MSPPSSAMDAWCDAIRLKPSWPSKVLDEERNLCDKWMHEANLEGQIEGEEIARAIGELKAEARRILAFDSIAHICSSEDEPEAPRSVSNGLVDADLAKMLDDVRARLDDVHRFIASPELGDECGVRTADGIIPESLHSLLESELDALASSAPAPDFHPGSDGKVLDIIHPSLYPYVHGSTRVVSGEEPEGSFRSKTELAIEHPYGDNPDPIEHESLFSWLPSVFRIGSDGTARCIGYINNAGLRSQRPRLYAAIENTFALTVPLIEEALNEPFKLIDTPSYQRWQARKAWRQEEEEGKEDSDGVTPAAWLEMASKVQARAFERRVSDVQPEFGNLREPTKLGGTDVKVIVKAAEYRLKPGQRYEGSWHIEGAPHEMIAASVIYYYSTSPEMSDRGLALRRVRLDVDKPNEEEEHASEDYSISYVDEEGEYLDGASEDFGVPDMDIPSDWGSDFDVYAFNASVRVGQLETTGGEAESKTGRVVVFPNYIQHRVSGLENPLLTEEGLSENAAVAATRKILCFFVIREDRDKEDPLRITLPGIQSTFSFLSPVITTLQVPPQQHELRFPALHFWLARVCKTLTGRDLPPELSHLIFAMGGQGFSREEAERWRRELMVDRGQLVKSGDEVWESSFGLCEH